MDEPSSSSQGPTRSLPSGGRSLEGYFYQLDVSILTALDLVLARKVAREIVQEPATEEDGDRVQQDELEGLNWRICRVWFTDWCRDLQVSLLGLSIGSKGCALCNSSRFWVALKRSS